MAPSRKILLDVPAMSEMLIKSSLPGCKKQIFLFANMARRHLLQAGVDEARIKEALEGAFEDFSPNLRALNEECMLMVRETVDNFINSEDLGRDLIGRALRRFCFEAVPGQAPAPGPGRSQSQSETVQGGEPALSERLADLFLMSVRGSVEGVDPIMSLPILFGTDLARLDQTSQEFAGIVADYKMGEEDDAPVYWNGFFLDRRTMALTLDFIGAVQEKMREAGAKNTLLILENLESKHQRRYGAAFMERPITLDDVYLLMGLLEAASENLAKSLESSLVEKHSEKKTAPIAPSHS